jgi:hypothetical protein
LLCYAFFEYFPIIIKSCLNYVMASKPVNWVSEERALEMLFNGYTKSSLRIFTRNEKRKKLPIRTKKLNHKTILYSGTDILNYINAEMEQ